MKKNLLVFVALIASIATLIFFRPSWGWKLHGIFSPSVILHDEVSLVAENENLKTELAQLKVVKSQIPDKPFLYLRAMVYSRYPMNFKNEILVSVGQSDGVAEGRAAVFNKILIGKVLKVFDNTALVETVFDSRFQSSVRIGDRGFSALFQGGSLPKAVLISEKAEIRPGDIVYSVSPDFPYGLAIGEVTAVEPSADKLFQEATIGFVYDVNAIGTILIAK